MKKKIVTWLVGAALAISSVAAVSAEEQIKGTEDSVITLTGSCAEKSVSVDVDRTEVKVIGYKISWNSAPSIQIIRNREYGKIWDPATLSYVSNENDPNATYSYKLGALKNSICSIENLSNADVNVSCSFSPAAGFEDVGLTFSITGTSSPLAQAAENTAGGSRDILFSTNALEALPEDVLEKLYEAMQGATAASEIGSFTIHVS